MDRTLERWAAHWNAKASTGNAIELNGYCIDGVPIDPELYHAAVIAPWIDRLELSPEHHVLDVGCGSGQLLRELESRAARVVGTDFSAAQLSQYRGSAETHVCAADDLPFTGQPFDRIVMASVAHYFPSASYLQTVIARLVGLLRQPGILLIGDMLIGDQPPNTPYLWYEQTRLRAILEGLGERYALEEQSDLKRTINTRYDVRIFKD